MSYLVTGTRERIFPARNQGEAVGAVEDELDAMGPGWVALTSEAMDDGSLRVIYGRLPDEATDAQPALHPVPAGRSIRADIVRAVATVVAVCTFIVLGLAGIALLATGT